MCLAEFVMFIKQNIIDYSSGLLTLTMQTFDQGLLFIHEYTTLHVEQTSQVDKVGE